MLKKIVLFLLSVIILLSVSGCGNTDRNIHSEKTEKQPEQSAENMAESLETDYADNHGNHESPGLNLSELSIKISSDEKEAVFQLYDTKAAEKLYEQLPLVLDTENFRNAQWMFYPPESLPVTADEAYHDGRKGELSYYEPWGDAFILYEDFYAGDEMHRLGICTSGTEYLESFDGTVTLEKLESSAEDQEGRRMGKQMRIMVDEHEIVFELNDSAAAESLYGQLPFQVEISDYSDDEKIFYPPEGLETSNTPLADAKTGTLAYFAPWGDVVMFYKEFGSYNGLYELGQVISGGEYIESIPEGTYIFEK